MKSAPQAGVNPEDSGDDGAILMFVLILLCFLGIGVVPVVAAALANAETTSVSGSVDTGFYAADGGIEYAIQDLRAGNVTCGSQSTAITIPSSLDGPGALPISASATCTTATTSSTSILTATITSSVGASTKEKQFTDYAVVAINMLAPNRNASVESWSSVQS